MHRRRHSTSRTQPSQIRCQLAVDLNRAFRDEDNYLFFLESDTRVAATRIRIIRGSVRKFRGRNRYYYSRRKRTSQNRAPMTTADRTRAIRDYTFPWPHFLTQVHAQDNCTQIFLTDQRDTC